MFKRNVFILITLLAVIGCNEKRYEIISIKEMPVQIKFTIPNNHIVNNKINSERENKIRSRLERYPKIRNLQLQLHSNISSIGYYEYVGELSDEKVAFFVFDSSGDIAIRGFKSKERLDAETRYELGHDGLHIYKKLFKGKSEIPTISVFYEFEDRSISFYLDDGFSIW